MEIDQHDMIAREMLKEHNQPTVFFLTGERIGLRAVTEADINQRYLSWMNDPQTTRFLQFRAFPQTLADLKAYWTAQQKKEILFLAICLLDGTHIGNIHVGPISWIDRRADVAFILGDVSQRGKGYMTEALGLVEDHCFKTLNLNRLQAGFEEENMASWKVFKKNGWKAEGLRVQFFFRDGKFVDMYNVAKLKQ